MNKLSESTIPFALTDNNPTSLVSTSELSSNWLGNVGTQELGSHLFAQR
jgi:hypothetical protein